MTTKLKQPESLPKNLDKAVKVETVDFNDPNRFLTCLEVDFPIAKINELSASEGNAGKPIYQMSKWFARRNSSIFRSILIAAATKAPEDKTKAAQYVWDLYYANHQKADNFKDLKVMDIFMGGGTTLVEGARLGFDVYGNDLNPVAWFVTKNELTPVDPKEVEKAFNEIEAEVKPQIMPFYTTTCPRGHKGYWIDKGTDKKLPEDFDPIDLPFDERKNYEYYGPEIIYTFWAKHGHCIDEKCQHRTPILNSHVLAIKELSVNYQEIECPGCKKKLHFEQQEVRIAPGSTFIVDENETPFIIASLKKEYNCPCCNYKLELYPNDCNKDKKVVNLTLLISPEWLKGSPGIDEEGLLGGYIDATADKTKKWFKKRLKSLELIEYRGILPNSIRNPLNSSNDIEILKANVPIKDKDKGKYKYVNGEFICGLCGKKQTFIGSISKVNISSPMMPYLLQCYCPICNKEGNLYNGKYFKSIEESDIKKLIYSDKVYQDFFYPTEPLQYTHMTHQRSPLPSHGINFWYQFFNSRQLIIHSILREKISNYQQPIKNHLLGTFQQYLRNQNMSCFWNIQADKMEPFFSNNNYQPKMNIIENNFSSRYGRGNWLSCVKNTLKGIKWLNTPEEKYLCKNNKGKFIQIKDSFTFDPNKLYCCSSTELKNIENRFFDIVVTDPPFGHNIYYSDLADFFYVWLKRTLKTDYPNLFSNEFTPKSQETIPNQAEHPDIRTKEEKKLKLIHPADEFYKNSLTACYAEAYRILKDGGIMAFTFHHNEFEAWIAVLEALFNAGFILEATYPIRSDETKGENAPFGSKKIEYDIIHVCRKRLNPPEPVSWAKMRRWVKAEVEQLTTITELYRNQNLSEADIKIILWGKFLEFYSKHYGQVFTAENDVLSVKDAILGITQMLDDESKKEELRPPQLAEPITRLFLQVFLERTEITRDEFHKTIRGTGHSPEDFKTYGWVKEERKIFYKIAIPEVFQELTKSGKRRDTIKKDIDQAYFFLGAALDKTNKINILDELKDGKIEPKKAVDDILLWVAETDLDDEIKKAAKLAHKLVVDWRSKKASSAPKEDSLQLSLLLDS